MHPECFYISFPSLGDTPFSLRLLSELKRSCLFN